MQTCQNLKKKKKKYLLKMGDSNPISILYLEKFQVRSTMHQFGGTLFSDMHHNNCIAPNNIQHQDL